MNDANNAELARIRDLLHRGQYDDAAHTLLVTMRHMMLSDDVGEK